MAISSKTVFKGIEAIEYCTNVFFSIWPLNNDFGREVSNAMLYWSALKLRWAVILVAPRQKLV